MSYTNAFGAVTNTSNTGYPASAGIYHTGTPQPTGRLAANGNRPIHLSGVYVLSAYNAGGIVAFFSSPNYDLGSGYCYHSGGAFVLWIDYSSGTLYFGRDSGMGGVVFDTGDSTTWPGGIPGGVYWEQAPLQPTGLAAVTSPTIPGQIDLTWTNPTDDGQSALTGIRVEWATDAAFTTGLGSANIGVLTAYSVTGLTPGVTYYFRVAARNAVTTAASTYSVYSSTASAVARSGVKVWDGAAWTPGSVRAWSGAAHSPGVVKVWNGAAWVPAL